jgi:ubiquinone/menaquinone biosynthesis C-methylase UbiE
VDKNTGVDLEKLLISPKRPFDLVYSNYVLHKLKYPEQLIKTAYQNLKKNGWLFLHTFDQSDKNGKSKLSKKWLEAVLAKQGFVDMQCKVFRYYDNEPEHKHWHKILEGVARKL